MLERIRRDVASGQASGQVLGTPTLFIDGVVHRDGYDPPTAPGPSRLAIVTGGYLRVVRRRLG